MKPAYKLQEFVAHSSNVNCLKIGRKSSRVLVTGGEDHKVNMWAIGKPNAILSLSSHSSAVESVTFDSAEVLVVAGAASGTIKLWDLEEAKIVRTLTGHRSNCISVDFHPFGEFFASGSLDTNLKIWDIRHKGCIHTYKGHTRGVNAIKFSPDGRWVVSGGEDNIIKLWDLTAGKLLHDFKYHDGQITCLDFHPHEFLLSTGSADKTVKFWDLETFEPIGSAGPEASNVRSIVFNPDGRTLLCGMHESLKVFSWEPLRCHDVIDIGWSKLADLSIHEGKLLGCSSNQSCVGVWVVDLSRVGSFSGGGNARPNGMSGSKSSINSNQSVHQVTDGSLRSESTPKNPNQPMLESSIKEMKLSTENVLITPQRDGNTAAGKVPMAAAQAYAMASKKAGATKGQPIPNHHSNRLNVCPVLVPRDAAGSERTALEAEHIKLAQSAMTCKGNDAAKSEPPKEAVRDEVFRAGSRSSLVSTLSTKKCFVDTEHVNHIPILNSDTSSIGVCVDPEDEKMKWMGSMKLRRPASAEAEGDPLFRMAPLLQSVAGQHTLPEPLLAGSIETVRLRTLAAYWERKGKAFEMNIQGTAGSRVSVHDTATFLRKGNICSAVENIEGLIIDDAATVEEVMQQHTTFIKMMQSRFTKLQVVKRFWAKNDMRGATEVMGKMSDNAVLVEVLGVLIDKSDVITLEICALLLPSLTALLSSESDRYLTTTLTVLRLLVSNFGSIIHTTRMASPSFGVDLHAEERLERCNSCYEELQNVAQSLLPLLRKGGDIGKVAQELSIALQEV